MPDHPTSYDALYPGRFLKAGLLNDRPITLKVQEVFRDELQDDKGKNKRQGIVRFHPDKSTPVGRELDAMSEMQLAMNRTNGECIKAMFGANVQEWVGHLITICPEEDFFGKEKVPCIRIAGSPELNEPIEVIIKLPRRKPKTRILRPTGEKPKAQKPEPAVTPDEYAAFLAQLAPFGWEPEAILTTCAERWKVDPRTLPLDRLMKLAGTLAAEVETTGE